MLRDNWLQVLSWADRCQHIDERLPCTEGSQCWNVQLPCKRSRACAVTAKVSWHTEMCRGDTSKHRERVGMSTRSTASADTIRCQHGETKSAVRASHAGWVGISKLTLLLARLCSRPQEAVQEVQHGRRTFVPSQPFGNGQGTKLDQLPVELDALAHALRACCPSAGPNSSTDRLSKPVRLFAHRSPNCSAQLHRATTPQQTSSAA